MALTGNSTESIRETYQKSSGRTTPRESCHPMRPARRADAQRPRPRTRGPCTASRTAVERARASELTAAACRRAMASAAPLPTYSKRSSLRRRFYCFYCFRHLNISSSKLKGTWAILDPSPGILDHLGSGPGTTMNNSTYQHEIIDNAFWKHRCSMVCGAPACGCACISM